MQKISFWQEFTPAFKFPISGHGLLFLLLVTILCKTSFQLTDKNLFILTNVVLGSFTLKYCLRALTKVAHGFDIAPRFNSQFLWNNYEKLLPLLFVCSALFAPYFMFADKWTSTGQLAFKLFALMLLPSLLMITTLEGNVFILFHPWRLTKILFTLGRDYLLALFAALLIYFGYHNSLSFAAMHLTESALILLSIGLAVYLSLALCYLFGRLIYHKHQDLGFKAEIEHLESGRDLDQESKSKELLLAEDLILAGDFTAAADCLSSAFRNTADDFPLHDKYHKLLKLMGANNKLMLHGSDYISKCLKFHKDLKAIEIYDDLSLTLGAGNIELKAQDCYYLAKAARHFGKGRQALALLQQFAAQHSKHELYPNSLYLQAKTLVDYFNDDAKALELLAELEQGYQQKNLEKPVQELKKLLTTAI